ncbi:toll/interleukin-1 receptor domain-containing protein [Micromonospora sp. ATA32]|nr:toll/interleukin-1 receptor domain-containing protein [Micromonospora sp. ATA32]
MSRIFLSYASEDGPLVDSVYRSLIERLPNHSPWIDKYEIVAGESLITKIAEGMDSAEKFFVFLSSKSISKPWVQRELRRAIIREIEGIDPNFIIPVKVGELDKLPPFLEDKKYIDLGQLREEEWLAAFDSSISGTPILPAGPIRRNVEVWAECGPEGQHVTNIFFKAVGWAETFSVAVATNKDIAGATYFATSSQTEIDEIFEPRLYAVRFETPELRPGKPPFWIRVEFAEGTDARRAIDQVVPWRPGPPN